MIIGIFCPSDKFDFIIKSLKLSKYRVLEYSAFTTVFLSNVNSLEILVIQATHPHVVPFDSQSQRPLLTPHFSLT